MIEGSERHIEVYLHIRTQKQGMKSAGVEPTIAAIEPPQSKHCNAWQSGSAVVTLGVTKFCFP